MLNTITMPRSVPITTGGHMDENDMTVTDAAKAIKVSVSTLARAARHGQLEARKMGNTWITTKQAALAWKQTHYKPTMKRK